MDRGVPAKDSGAVDAVSVYLKDVKRYPLISQKEELALASRAVGGDSAARDEMLCRNLRLVVHVAKYYQGKGVELIDLIGEGNLGLITALDRFKPELGHRFSTYATHWIQQKIRRAVHDQSRLVRIPVYIQGAIAQLRNNPSSSEEKARRIRKFEAAIKAQTWSISSMTQSEVRELTVAAGEIDQQLDSQIVEGLLRSLSKRSSAIVRLRFGMVDSTDNFTLEELGRIYDISRERVRQIIKQALGDLKKPAAKLFGEGRMGAGAHSKV